MTGLEPIIIAGIISAVGSLISGIANVSSQNKINKENLANQDNINQSNLDNQWSMWNATNDYNKPSAQMARFKEAGLSPHLIYGQSNTASAMNVGNAVSYNQVAPNFDFLGNSLAPLMSAISQEQTIKGQRLDNQKKGFDNKWLEDTLDDRIRLTESQANYAEKQLTTIGYMIEDRELDRAIKETETLMKSLDLEIQQKSWDNQKLLVEMGLPPNLDPKYVVLFAALGSFFKQVTGRVLNFNELAGQFGNLISETIK